MLIKMNNGTFKAREMDVLSDDRCELLITFLNDRKVNKPTLREIKRAFPELDFEDSYIENLIEMGIINRHHGKYELALTVVSKEQLKTILEESSNLLDSKKNEIAELIKDHEVKTFDLIYTLFSSQPTSDIMCFEHSELAEKMLSYSTRVTKVDGKRTTYVSLGSYYPYYSHNISDYFNYLTRNQNNLPSQFIDLRDRLGDINLDYFMNYCDRKLRRMEKGKLVSASKPDLFLEALHDMGYCNISEGSYQYNITQISVDSEPSWFKGFQKVLATENEGYSFIQLVGVLDWLLKNNLIENLETYHGML